MIDIHTWTHLKNEPLRVHLNKKYKYEHYTLRVEPGGQNFKIVGEKPPCNPVMGGNSINLQGKVLCKKVRRRIESYFY